MKYTWKDIVSVKGQIFAEEFPISGLKDGEHIYDIDDFYNAVAIKHNAKIDDIKTYMMDNIDFNPNELPFGGEACGCYINGIPEWMLH